MGNMAACLVQQRAAALPAVNPKQRLVSLKLLMKAIHKMKKRPLGGSSGKAKIDSKSPSSSTTAAAAVAGADGSIGGGGVEERSKAVSNNPKGAVLRSRLHGRGGGGGLKKGAVRVKVVLTKEEAARLLSLTVGGQKTAAQIVAEIKRMEARRAANAAASAWRPALASIPEESS
ncbi:hypothetical protein SEVIR_5G018700v4 [Setaria viridis]|uniref:DUF7890 domain-containing protein n=1 Tax=Setaria viridis TaxID=4556 RepID=A0A4U6U8Z1_SETVI|nr:uncharacterized protein LOC117858272 [Setaria viridis]TKW12158.1 hypothetical protein SEVIR_5G018700v2 [Setaria viridis]